MSRRSLSPDLPRSPVSLANEFRVLMSIPEQKWSPVPERTMTDALGFWSRDWRAIENSGKKSRDKAFR